MYSPSQIVQVPHSLEDGYMIPSPAKKVGDKNSLSLG